MLGAKERAAGTAPKNNLHVESYPNSTQESSKNIKQDIGELLWCLQFPVGELSQVGWALFERLLRRHVALNYTSKCLSEPLESTNTLQGVSG